MGTDKTRTYSQRSRSSPLQFFLRSDRVVRAAFPLILLPIGRLNPLTIYAGAPPPSVLRHFRCRTPLLEGLDTNIANEGDPVLDNGLFNGDLSSLRELSLHGVIPGKPPIPRPRAFWSNVRNHSNTRLPGVRISLAHGFSFSPDLKSIRPPA